MLLSIVVPVYNAEKYLVQCIESVLNQSYGKFELILINDGSEDGSAAIMDVYAQKDPRVIVHHKENGGSLAARQTAINMARGDYCLFLDADDYFENILLEKVYETIIRSNCDLCLYKWYIADGNGKRAVKGVFAHNTLFTTENKKDFYKKLITINELNSLWIKAVRTDILKNRTQDLTGLHWVSRTEDLLFSLEIFTKAECILYLDLPLYNYRISNKESLTKSFDPDAFKGDTAVRKEVLKYMRIWGIDDETTLTSFYNWFIRNALRLMKGSYMIGIPLKKKKGFIREMIDEPFVNQALSEINAGYFSKLDRIEIKLLKRGRINTMCLLNSLIFNKYIAKRIIEKREKGSAACKGK